MPEIVIIADDVTGAADSAAACAAQEFSASVILDLPDGRVMSWPHTDIVSIDANTRCLSAGEAAATAGQIVNAVGEHSLLAPGGILFKKLDSTLRGHFGEELRAVVSAAQASRSLQGCCIVMAPALPAQGRTTVGGRQLLSGQPVHECDIPTLLGKAGLSCRTMDLAAVRAGALQVRAEMVVRSREADVLLCDAENEDDLRSIAGASMVLRDRAVWAGSAGFAAHLPRAAGMRVADRERETKPAVSGPTMFVVGTAAPVSRRQAGALAALPGLTTFHVEAASLLNSTAAAGSVVEALQADCDVLVTIDEKQRCGAEDAHLLTRALARIIAPCAPRMGALVATGGETARAVFDNLGIRRLRIVAEVEPGIPLSIAEGWTRALPIITKAGGFGSPEALMRCREVLSALHRASAPAGGPGSSVC